MPRVATEKERGLRERYGADERTTRYFTLHATADVYHANVWREQLGNSDEEIPKRTRKRSISGSGSQGFVDRARRH